MVKISFIIAAYNAQHFIHRAIDSVLEQSAPAHEIIIVNDKSTDDTAAVLDELAAQYLQIKVHHLAENGGPSAARNKGIEVATGEWLAVLDADDAVTPDFVATVSQAITHYQPDILATNFYWYDIDNARTTSKGLSQTNEAVTVSKYDFVKGARPYSDEADYGLLKPVFNLAFLRQHQLRYPTDIRHGEDFTLLASVLFQDAQFTVINAPLYLYTTRDSGLSKTAPAYPKMAQAARNMCNLPAVERDAKLKQLLQQRADALLQLNAAIMLDWDWRKKNIKALLSHSLNTPFYLKKLTGRIIRTLTGK